MGWESRKGSKRLFYVRKVREGGRVRSVYCGAGEAGESAAREDAERRGKPGPVAPPPVPITRAEIVRRAEVNGERLAFLVRLRRVRALEALGRGSIYSALSAAGIKEEEVARRGLDLPPPGFTAQR
jgi:hypothetical protein